MAENYTLYTIEHEGRDIENFVARLKEFKDIVLKDVREDEFYIVAERVETLL